MEDKKLLNLMRFWLFGTFLIVFVASTVYLGLFINVWEALKNSFSIWGITAVLCVAWYFIYKWYLSKKAAK
jgi:hypothetical protein